MDQLWNRIEEAAKANNGFIQTAQVEELGISRPMLKKYTDAGKLERIRKGLYVLTDDLAMNMRCFRYEANLQSSPMEQHCIYGGFPTELLMYMTLLCQEEQTSTL